MSGFKTYSACINYYAHKLDLQPARLFVMVFIVFYELCPYQTYSLCVVNMRVRYVMVCVVGTSTVTLRL